MSHPFCRYDLRTTDPDAARLFYTEVIGLEFDAELAVWPLHERALAAGAPPHWLGSIAVSDVETAMTRLLAQGAEALGPAPLRGADGVAFAVVRDPVGAVVGVRESASAAHSVAWHQLHARDRDRAWAGYSELFGWTHEETVPTDEVEGGHWLFTAGEARGSMANTARWPGVHPHWLFYFPVADLDAVASEVEARGGSLSGIGRTLGNGDRVWPCEDPHGAAFGLYQRLVS